jgi:hypothetical protein
VKLSLCLTKYHAMKTYWGLEVEVHALTSALGGGEWSASRPGRFTPAVSYSDIHWIGGWAGPRAGLDTEVASTRIFVSGNTKCVWVMTVNTRKKQTK